MLVLSCLRDEYNIIINLLCEKNQSSRFKEKLKLKLHGLHYTHFHSYYIPSCTDTLTSVQAKAWFSTSSLTYWNQKHFSANFLLNRLDLREFHNNKMSLVSQKVGLPLNQSCSTKGMFPCGIHQHYNSTIFDFWNQSSALMRNKYQIILGNYSELSITKMGR